MANSLLHRIGSSLLRHSPAPNLDQIHRLHRQAAGTLTCSSGCKRFFSGGHDHDDIGRACEILHSFFVFNKSRSVWRNISLRLSWCWCMLGHQNTWFSLSCFNLGIKFNRKDVNSAFCGNRGDTQMAENYSSCLCCFNWHDILHFRRRWTWTWWACRACRTTGNDYVLCVHCKRAREPIYG